MSEGDVSAELERLASLYERGLLTEDEFAAAKRRALGEGGADADAADDTPPPISPPPQGVSPPPKAATPVFRPSTSRTGLWGSWDRTSTWARSE
jgi:hypothetical protein